MTTQPNTSGLNVDNMRKWVARLRDPDARQVCERLRDEDGAMCCLGHACDVSELDEWGVAGEYLESNALLPREVMEWLGIDSSDPILVDRPTLSPPDYAYATEESASTFNDQYRYTLSQIADCIEATWPEVKVTR